MRMEASFEKCSFTSKCMYIQVCLRTSIYIYEHLCTPVHCLDVSKKTYFVPDGSSKNRLSHLFRGVPEKPSLQHKQTKNLIVLAKATSRTFEYVHHCHLFWGPFSRKPLVHCKHHLPNGTPCQYVAVCILFQK